MARHNQVEESSSEKNKQVKRKLELMQYYN